MKQCICGRKNLYTTGALIQEEALQMKERMVEGVREFDGLHASNGLLE